MNETLLYQGSHSDLIPRVIQGDVQKLLPVLRLRGATKAQLDVLVSRADQLILTEALKTKLTQLNGMLFTIAKRTKSTRIIYAIVSEGPVFSIVRKVKQHD